MPVADNTVLADVFSVTAALALIVLNATLWRVSFLSVFPNKLESDIICSSFVHLYAFAWAYSKESVRVESVGCRRDQNGRRRRRGAEREKKASTLVFKIEKWKL